MSHAEKCPVCGGSGRVPISEAYGGNTTIPLTDYCHGCDGKGWVAVEDPVRLVPVWPEPEGKDNHAHAKAG